MTEPHEHPMAVDLYGQLSPVAYGDDTDPSKPLRTLVTALAAMFRQAYDLVMDDLDKDISGWGKLLHPDHVSWNDGSVHWLAQLAGKTIPSGMSEAAARIRLRSTDGFFVGTPNSIKGAALQVLTGTNPRVVLRERYDPSQPNVDKPYHYQVIVYKANAPTDIVPVEWSGGQAVRWTSVRLQAAIDEQRPIGHIAHHTIIPGQDYQRTRESGRTYQQTADLGRTYDQRSRAQE